MKSIYIYITHEAIRRISLYTLADRAAAYGYALRISEDGELVIDVPEKRGKRNEQPREAAHRAASAPPPSVAGTDGAQP